MEMKIMKRIMSLKTWEDMSNLLPVNPKLNLFLKRLLLPRKNSQSRKSLNASLIFQLMSLMTMAHQIVVYERWGVHDIFGLRLCTYQHFPLFVIINSNNLKLMSDEIEPQVLQLYKPTKKIGSGAYGHVWRVVDRRTQTVKALKKNFDAFSNSTDAQRTYREIMFLKQLRHPNIIILENIVRARNDKDIYLIFEHMDIDLHTLIRQNNNQQHLQEKHKQYIIYQIAKSIYYLHNANIIHRDLKPSNILINQNCDAKLCDFGLVRSLEQPQEEEMAIMTDYIATRWYRAPELLMGSRVYSKEVDVWALGCLVGEMFRGKAMFPGNSTINQIEKVLAWTGAPSAAEIKSLSTNVNKGIMDLLGSRRKSNKNEFFPNKISSSCMDLISKMLEFDPSKRIKIQEILKHEYLSEFYCQREMKEIRESKMKIQLHINDNTKLSLKQYRDLIYSEISPKGGVLESRQIGKSGKNDENLIKKKDPSKEKVASRMKTCSIEEAENGIMAPATNYQPIYQPTEVKIINKQCKSSLSKKTITASKPRTPSMRKKGISLCSKEILAQSNSINKKKYSQPGQSIEKDSIKYCQTITNGKKLKTVSRSCTQKYDKGKKSFHQTKNNSKKVVCTGYFINQNIGKKEFEDRDYQKTTIGYIF